MEYYRNVGLDDEQSFDIWTWIIEWSQIWKIILSSKRKLWHFGIFQIPIQQNQIRLRFCFGLCEVPEYLLEI